MSGQFHPSSLRSSGWGDLPADLLSTISDCLLEATDIRRFRGVCRSWRSSVMPIQSKHIITPLLPLTLSIADPLDQFSRYLISTTNAVYHLRSSSNIKANWIVSVQESQPGKLLLRHALTSEPIPGFSRRGIDMTGWSLTRLSISHSFGPYQVSLVDDMAVLRYNMDSLCALRHCLSPDAAAGQLLDIGGVCVSDFINFNGCIYGVDDRGAVYLLDPARLHWLPLTCVSLPESCRQMFIREKYGKRFVVSDGDLYIVFNPCINLSEHEYDVYKVVIMDGGDYNLKEVMNLGDRVFVINKECSFSVSARDLPPPMVGNCIIVSGGAFDDCSCFSDLCIYHLGGKPTKMVRCLYPALFKPPLLWTHQLQRVVSQTKRKRTDRKRNKKKVQCPGR